MALSLRATVDTSVAIVLLQQTYHQTPGIAKGGHARTGTSTTGTQAHNRQLHHVVRHAKLEKHTVNRYRSQNTQKTSNTASFARRNQSRSACPVCQHHPRACSIIAFVDDTLTAIYRLNAHGEGLRCQGGRRDAPNINMGSAMTVYALTLTEKRFGGTGQPRIQATREP